MKIVFRVALVLSVMWMLSGCETAGGSGGAAAGSLPAMDAKQARTLLKEGNARFVRNVRIARDLTARVKQTSTAQFPFASIVSCADSRVPPELLFDQGIGDLFVLRVAGNVVDSDILGSLEYGSKILRIKLILVLGHTQCGAVKGAIDHAEMGNLTALVNKIRPAVEAAPMEGGARTSKNPAFVDAVCRENVRQVMRQIGKNSPILAKQITAGEVRLEGGMYDLATGRVVLFEE